MKRGKGLVRRTPLVAKTSLRRTPFTSERFPMQRRTILQQVSEKRRRDNVERRKVVSAMRLASDGRCPRCGHSGIELHGHERVRRSQGGSVLAPDVLICDLCNTAVASSPRVVLERLGGQPEVAARSALTPSQARSLTGLIVEFAVGDPS